MISAKLLKTLTTAQVNQALTDTLDDLAELFTEMRRRLGPASHAKTAKAATPEPGPVAAIAATATEPRKRKRSPANIERVYQTEPANQVEKTGLFAEPEPDAGACETKTAS